MVTTDETTVDSETKELTANIGRSNATFF